MKISELIESLQAIKAEKGELHTNVDRLEYKSWWFATSAAGEVLEVKVSREDQ